MGKMSLAAVCSHSCPQAVSTQPSTWQQTDPGAVCRGCGTARGTVQTGTRVSPSSPQRCRPRHRISWWAMHRPRSVPQSTEVGISSGSEGDEEQRRGWWAEQTQPVTPCPALSPAWAAGVRMSRGWMEHSGQEQLLCSEPGDRGQSGGEWGQAWQVPPMAGVPPGSHSSDPGHRSARCRALDPARGTDLGSRQDGPGAGSPSAGSPCHGQA